MGRHMKSNEYGVRKVKARVQAEKEVGTRCFHGRSDQLHVKMSLKEIDWVCPVVQVRNHCCS